MRFQSCRDAPKRAHASFRMTAIECTDPHAQRDIEKLLIWLKLEVFDGDLAKAQSAGRNLGARNGCCLRYRLLGSVYRENVATTNAARNLPRCGAEAAPNFGNSKPRPEGHCIHNCP